MDFVLGKSLYSIVQYDPQSSSRKSFISETHNSGFSQYMHLLGIDSIKTRCLMTRLLLDQTAQNISSSSTAEYDSSSS